MRYNYYRLMIFILFLSYAIVSVSAASDNISYTQYGVNIAAPDPDAQKVVDADNPESVTPWGAPVSFWELPPAVQLAYVMLSALTVLSLLKLFPFTFGRLKHALENPKTKDIFIHILNNPGLTIKQLAEERHINRGTLKYHLSQLFTNNKITLIRRGRISQLYHNTLAPNDKESIIAAYLRRDDKSQPILFTIMENPGVTNKDLSERFGLDKSTITDYMKKFTDDGLVEFRQDGRFKRCYLMQDARMIMLRYRPQ